MNKYKFSDLYVGLEQSFKIALDQEKMNKFLEISGDINPLHTDKTYAQEKGFSSQVVYGLLTASFYSTLVGVHLPGKFCLLQAIDIQFSNPVYINDNLTVHGKVSYLNEAYKQVEIKATIINQAGKKVSKATIKVGVTDE